MVNDNYRRLPNADILYAADAKWWNYHIESVRDTFTGALYTQYRDEKELSQAEAHGIKAVQGVDKPGLGRGLLHFNGNSGAQAINLAYLKGAKRILLLGYDMQNTNGEYHWFGKHPQGLANTNYSSYQQRFTQLAAELEQQGVEVINCSRQTGLHQFKRMNIHEALTCGQS